MNPRASKTFKTRTAKVVILTEAIFKAE